MIYLGFKTVQLYGTWMDFYFRGLFFTAYHISYISTNQKARMLIGYDRAGELVRMGTGQLPPPGHFPSKK